MAHYALLDENNVVINVITGIDENIVQTDLDGTQVGGSAEAWEEFYATRSWLNATSCKRTSYNRNIRKNYAGIGFTYDPILDAFIPPKPFNSWLLDEDLCLWEAPVAYPTDNGTYTWNEDTLSWDVS
jgi:hypothetical protein